MKKVFIFLAILFASSIVFGADINPGTGRPDAPGVMINTNLRDRNTTSPTTYAPTMNCEENFTFSNFTSTTNVKTTPGLLHSININTAAAVLFTVIDSTSVNVTTPLIASFPASAVVGTRIFDLQFVNGLQINMGASGPDVTVSYR